MAQYDNRYAQAGAAGQAGSLTVDQGLRAYMSRVYTYMSAGVLLSGIAAYSTYAAAVIQTKANGGLVLSPFGQAIYASPLKWVIMLAPLAFVFFLSFRAYKMSVAATQISFWLFAAVMGVSLSSIFVIFKLGSIVNVFFITSAMFAALSLYGYTTKKDLSGWGTFLFMGVIGLCLAGLVNVFLQSPALQFAISCIAVLVFAALTAYDTQQIKDQYYEVYGDAQLAAKSAIMGALSLYLDFINMFTSMLSLFGDRE
jgi:hypothetical protein